MTQADLTNLYKMRTVARLQSAGLLLRNSPVPAGSHRPHRPVQAPTHRRASWLTTSTTASTLALDDLAADLESLLTAYDNERFELNKSLELARAHEGVNLILSSTNVRRGHCCPDADGRFVTEYDREARACRCDQRAAGILHDQNPLPF